MSGDRRLPRDGWSCAPVTPTTASVDPPGNGELAFVFPILFIPVKIASPPATIAPMQYSLGDMVIAVMLAVICALWVAASPLILWAFFGP